MSVTAVAIGGSALVGAYSANKASKAQANSAREANALEREMFDKNIELQEPFRQGGMAAQNRLMTLLGLKAPGGGMQKIANTAAGAVGGMGMSGPQAIPPVDQNALRAQLLPKFTSGGQEESYYNDAGQQMFRQGAGTVDEAGLQAAMQAQQAQGGGGQPGGTDTSFSDENDPEFGSLMKDFTPEDFLAGKDPGYAHRMEQGERGLERSAAARAGLYSGKAMKDAVRFNQGEASQEYGNAFNRFQTNRANKLNPLQSLMGAGQTSANTMGQAATGYGSRAGENTIGAGNARASGIVGASNAISQGVGQYANMQQQNQLMNRIWGPTGAGSYGGNGGGAGNYNFGGGM